MTDENNMDLFRLDSKNDITCRYKLSSHALKSPTCLLTKKYKISSLGIEWQSQMFSENCSNFFYPKFLSHLWHSMHNHLLRAFVPSFLPSNPASSIWSKKSQFSLSPVGLLNDTHLEKNLKCFFFLLVEFFGRLIMTCLVLRIFLRTVNEKQGKSVKGEFNQTSLLHLWKKIFKISKTNINIVKSQISKF